MPRPGAKTEYQHPDQREQPVCKHKTGQPRRISGRRISQRENRKAE